MATKTKKGWEQLFFQRIVLEKERETEKQKEYTRKRDEEKSMQAGAAEQLNMALERANSNVKNMAAKSKSFNHFLRFLLEAKPVCEYNCLIYEFRLGFYSHDKIFLYFSLGSGNIPSLFFSYSKIEMGGESVTVNHFQPGTRRDEEFLADLCGYDCWKIKKTLEELSSPESTIQFFYSHFGYLFKNIPIEV
jgi:hypothetical protein